MVTRTYAGVFACMLTLASVSGIARAQDEGGGYPAPPPPDTPLREAREAEPPPRENPREARLNALAKARSFNNAQKRDVGALWGLLDDAVAGKRAMVNDLALRWVGRDVLKEGGGVLLVPFTVMLDPARTAGGDVWLSWRVMPKPAASAKSIEPKDLQPVFEEVSVVPPRQAPAGRIIRAFAASPGEYDLYIVARDVTSTQRGAPSPKASVLKQTVTVPDLGTELTTSSVIVPATIRPLPAPLSPRDRIERPYAIGVLEVVPATTNAFGKNDELSLFFLIYNPGRGADGKPNLTVNYTFHSKQPGGEQVFNKTVPQILNATTLPAEFDPARHQLQTSQVVPLASFPPGDYRLEIAISDAVATKSITRDVLFTVSGG